MKRRHMILRLVVSATLGAAALAAAQTAPGWYPLFDGRTLKGWQAAEHPDSFKVLEGAIVADGPRAHLFYVGPVAHAQFKDFEFHIEVMTRPGANSGVYFHTRYQPSGWPRQGLEVQINNSQPGNGSYYEFKKTGSLCGIRNLYKSPVRDNEWFAIDLAVHGRRVAIWVNQTKVVDYLEPDASFGERRRLGRGTIALQCYDADSKVYFRNIWIRPLPPIDRGPSPKLPVPPETYRQLLSLYAANFPVINLHSHLKGGLTIDDIVRRFYATGINYGVAVNCGLGFSVTNDAGIDRWLQRYHGLPVFLAMQAEGREWTRLFSPDAAAKFDYVFTDAMTFADAQGRRMRLWIDKEVRISDPQVFMETYVGKITQIMREEPIDIYVNPTFLPQALADRYDELWTEKRMKRVIRAAAENGVAIEINDRLKLPKPKFIRLAKQAGVKFTFGANNSGKDDLGHLAYCLRMIRECGLEPSDMYVPGRRPSRIARILNARRPKPPREYVAYVGTYTGRGARGVYGWRIRVGDEEWTPLGCVAELPNPSFLAAGPDGRTLYAVSETGRFEGRSEGSVAAFRIDRLTGELRPLNRVSSGGAGPCHLSVEPGGRAALVANYGDGTVAALPVARDGSLRPPACVIRQRGSGPNAARQSGPHAHCAIPSPDGRFVLAADLGADKVFVYRLDAARALLKPNSPPSFSLPPGSGPRHLAFHPDGRRLYALNELASTVAMFEWDARRGTARLVGSWSLLPAGFTGNNTAAEIAVDSRGTYLYASNRGHDSIAVFRILLDGSLAPVDFVPSGGKRPRQFAIDPTGRFLWAANRDSNRVTVFRLDPQTGRPLPMGKELEIGSPACVLFVPLD